MFNKSAFDSSKKVENVSIDGECDVVFVSDLFVQDHVGGAELTSEAIISSSQYKVFKLRSREVTLENLEQGRNKLWIFGNYSHMDPSLIPTIIANLRYSIIEYDYKYCRYRSPEKHLHAENKECDCHNEMPGKMISAFMFGSENIFWMSRGQMGIYHSMFPFLKNRNNTVLSSVFDEPFFDTIKTLNNKEDKGNREKWIVVGSTSWIKGTDLSTQHCIQNNLNYETVWDLSYRDLLAKLSGAKGLVFLPRGSDTCPRLVIEAKLLGCDLIINENVQHASEAWFKTDDIAVTLSYLYTARSRFWSEIEKIITYKPTISGYTTTLNCIDQRYPFESSIKSLLEFCDQVVVVDGGSTDGTWEILEKMKQNNSSMIIHRQNRDWDSPRFAVYDGLQKALARALCSSEFCWQQDSDEIVHENDVPKIKNIIQTIPKNMDLIALPVIEYWGSSEKVRVDVNPWKWRLSRNRPYITHGIPSSLRKFDEDGHLYSLPGSDGCDYVRSDTYEPIPFATFYSKEANQLRIDAFKDSNKLSQYEEWFNSITDQLPAVYHYSWYDIKRKINTYKNYWSKHWQSLYNIDQQDTSENNMFFDKPWSEVTNSEIDTLSLKLEKELGGWIFHSKVDFSNPTPHMSVKNSHPKFIFDWLELK